MLYWLHRMFHGGGFWKYHAIHHSSEELEWISAARFHPVNLFIGTIVVDVILLIAGISPNIMLWVGPFTTFHSAFVHANLNWTLGPFKYVLATPVFHRWHHTSLEEGGNTNFAGTFPVWDILFGTFRMPEAELPERIWRATISDPARDRRTAGLSVSPIARSPVSHEMQTSERSRRDRPSASPTDPGHGSGWLGVYVLLLISGSLLLEQFRHLLADRRGPVDPRSRDVAARRHLFLHQGGRATGPHPPGWRRCVCRSYNLLGLGRAGGLAAGAIAATFALA